MTREQQIEAFIACNGVTRGPSTRTQAKSLRTLRREREQELMREKDEPCADPEVRSREIFGAVRANGGSVSDALDASKEI